MLLNMRLETGKANHWLRVLNEDGFCSIEVALHRSTPWRTLILGLEAAPSSVQTTRCVF